MEVVNTEIIFSDCKGAIELIETWLDKTEKENITALLAKAVNSKIEIEERIDADLIGGFVITIEDQQIDSSIKADLVRMKKKFNDSTYISKV